MQSSNDAENNDSQNKPEFEGWQDVLTALELATQKDQLDFLLSALLTFDEREALLSRMNILHELMKGERSQRQISQMLKVGIATITRGSTELKHTSPEKKQQLQQLLQTAAQDKR
ncbi:trp operon repressor [Vibrio sp. S17_S38]|uniref:trp operon repressor n=1 Tax=Vibrio sp. S17_S38 TaxID=2720229 RepID=UPI001680C017|nr:trp operon repressor [Vibrio sp. S17_S38]MBD1574188.1 trp operon repressor [Vibrio sp. S17_S38]